MLKSTSPAPHIFIVWSRNSHLGDFDLGVAKGVGGGGRGWGGKGKGESEFESNQWLRSASTEIICITLIHETCQEEGRRQFYTSTFPLVWSFGWLLLHLRCNVLNFPIFHLNIDFRKFWGKEKVLSED